MDKNSHLVEISCDLSWIVAQTIGNTELETFQKPLMTPKPHDGRY